MTAKEKIKNFKLSGATQSNKSLSNSNTKSQMGSKKNLFKPFHEQME